MPGHVEALESAERAQADIIKLREKKRVDEMSAIDRELWIIDCLFGDLQPRWTRAEKSATAAPVEFRFQFFCTRDEVRQIDPEKIVTLDHIGVAFFNQGGQPPDRAAL